MLRRIGVKLDDLNKRVLEKRLFIGPENNKGYNIILSYYANEEKWDESLIKAINYSEKFNKPEDHYTFIKTLKDKYSMYV